MHQNSLKEIHVPTVHGSRVGDETYNKLLGVTANNCRPTRNLHHALNCFFNKAAADPVITIVRQNDWVIVVALGTKHIALTGKHLPVLICEAALKIQNFDNATTLTEDN
jgi:hypothetical protein